ncbi:MAG: IS4 family transposase [Zoogloeaceae bacterium]|nr:IS4 family transposase [Zoogloeaceae bacterium]
MKTRQEPDFGALSRHIDREWVAQALAATGKASVRRRKLPAEQAVWLVIAQAMFRRQSLAEVIAHLNLVLPEESNPEIAKSALTQARQRLGEEPLAELFRLCAGGWDARLRPKREWHWRGLSRYAIDGSTLRTADSECNREHFGAQAYASGVAASYPQARLLTLTSLSTHLACDAVFGEYGKNEMRYAKELLASIPDHSLTVFDRGFLSAELLLGVQNKGQERNWLVPAKSNSKWERLDTHPNDYRVRMRVSPQARHGNAELPEYWEARAIETTWRGSKRILLTSLMDAKRWPADEIAEQYRERWRIETSYRELKQELLGDKLTLRSGSPQTVRQEIWGVLLTYNLIRLEMAEVASEAEVDPTQLSFVTAMHYLRYEWSWQAITAPGKLPEHLRHLRNRLGDLLIPPKRRGRTCPRVVKNTPVRYPQRQVMAVK